VQRGETLTDIARLYGVQASEIGELNEIEDPDRIFVGQVLRIPPPRRTS
jgi:nucleoid-associated protein YgaU